MVPFVRRFLAAGIARAGSVPFRVADSSAVSDYRNRGGRRPSIGLGDRDASGTRFDGDPVERLASPANTLTATTGEEAGPESFPFSSPFYRVMD